MAPPSKNNGAGVVFDACVDDVDIEHGMAAEGFTTDSASGEGDRYGSVAWSIVEEKIIISL